jgi:hypothetical protein
VVSLLSCSSSQRAPGDRSKALHRSGLAVTKERYWRPTKPLPARPGGLWRGFLTPIRTKEAFAAGLMRSVAVPRGCRGFHEDASASGSGAIREIRSVVWLPVGAHVLGDVGDKSWHHIHGGTSRNAIDMRARNGLPAPILSGTSIGGSCVLRLIITMPTLELGPASFGIPLMRGMVSTLATSWTILEIQPACRPFTAWRVIQLACRHSFGPTSLAGNCSKCVVPHWRQEDVTFFQGSFAPLMNRLFSRQ